MKKVIDLISVSIVEVPDNYIKCSICEGYYPPEDFRKPEQTKQTRTNCTECYEIDSKEWEKIEARVKAVKNSLAYKKLEYDMNTEALYFGNSISVAELIESLQQLAPTDRVFIGQDGYYAEGIFADIGLDMNHKMSIKGVKFYSIGHSSQNY